MPKPKRRTKDLNQPVTLHDFHELTDFIGDTVVTKEDLKVFAAAAFKTFTTKDDLGALEERLDGKITVFKDQILTASDKLARKLDILLTETATTGHRLTRLERHTGLRPRP